LLKFLVAFILIVYFAFVVPPMINLNLALPIIHLDSVDLVIMEKIHESIMSAYYLPVDKKVLK